MVVSGSKPSVRNIETFRPSPGYNLPPWVKADWEDYLFYRDQPHDRLTNQRPYFHNNYLSIEMGAEGINHATVNNLFTLLIGFWLNFHPEILAHLIGGCQLEKTSSKIAAAPDLVVYLGENHPRWHKGERRYLNLDQWGIPSLVGEISDTTLMRDADEKKHLYEALGIPEYWIIDTYCYRMFMLVLNEAGIYEEQETSKVFVGLEKALLEESLQRSQEEGNMQVAQWFAQQLQAAKNTQESA